MDRLKNIVVGVDFSKYSQNALAQAMRIARWNAAKLHVVHVIEPTLTTNLADAYGAPGVDTWHGFRDLARERTAEMISAAQTLSGPAGQTKVPDVDFELDILFGNPFVHLLREVRDAAAELLILGSNSSSSPTEGPGALATKCVHKAPAKVMLVRELSAEPFKCIVACVRFSDTCRLVIEQAIRIARQDKSSLHVLHVYTLPEEAVGDGGPMPEGAPESQEELETRLERWVKEFLPPFGSHMSGLKVEIHQAGLRDERAGVVESVRSLGANLVVLATRGRTGLKGTPSATTTEQIVREVPCCVLAIKPADFKYHVAGAPRRR